MRRGGQKAKGNSFENRIAEILSKWISDGERKDLFCKSPGSGSRATVQLAISNVLYSDQAGDIIATGLEGYALTKDFVIECKHYQDINLEGIVYCTKAGILEFWEQVTRDAKAHNKLPILIVRQNNRPILLGTNTPGAIKLEFLSFTLAHRIPEDLRIALFSEFIKNIKPSVLNSTKSKKIERISVRI